MSELKTKTVNSAIWIFVQRVASRGISFFFMIFMTRLLLPSDYGMVGMLAVFLTIAQTIIDCGFGQALIRKQNRTAIDESTVFYSNILASIFCYLVLFIIAPFVGDFYQMPELCNILRVMSLSFVISSLSSIQVLIYTIQLDFKTQSIINVLSGILAGVFGLYLAYKGYGVWALVWQVIMSSFFITLFYWIVSKWHPVMAFSKESFKELFSFGSKILGAQLLNNIYANISPIFIGKAYSSSDLGLYTKGSQMIYFPVSMLVGVFESVTYPVLCKLQNSEEQMRDCFLRFIKIAAFILFPIMVLLGVLSKPLVLSLFGEKWSETANYMMLLCYPCAVVPIQVMNLNILKVVGQSDYVLRIEVIGKILGVLMLIIALPISIYAICYGTIIVATISLFLNTFFTSKFIKLSALSQLKVLFPSFILSIIVGAIVYLMIVFINSSWTQLLLGGVLGLSMYIGIAYLLQMTELKEFFSLLLKK